MKNWKTSSLFVHIDTGEIIIFDKIYFEIIKTIKDYDNKKRDIRVTNFVRETRQQYIREFV